MTTPNTEQQRPSPRVRLAKPAKDYVSTALVVHESHYKKLERECAIYKAALQKIAKPALGGKQQQYDAQAALALARAALGR